MKKRILRRALVAVCVCLAAIAGQAQDRELVATYSVPDVPAMTILDATASSLERPVVPSELGLALANMVTTEGKVRSGAGFEVSLRTIAPSVMGNFYEYGTEWWRRFVSSFSFSVATVADSRLDSEPTVARGALGLRMVFWDESDPLLDVRYGTAEGYAEHACKDSPLREQPECEQKAYDDFARLWPERRWNGGGLSLASALSLAFEEAKWSNVQAERLRLWLVWSFGLGDLFLATTGVGGGYRPCQNEWELIPAFRAQLGAEGWRFGMQVVYHGSWNGPDYQASGQATLGIELQVSGGMWIKFSVGGDFTSGLQDPDVLALSNISWGEAPSW